MFNNNSKNNTANYSLKEVYDLLSKLYRQLAGEKHKDVQKKMTHYLAESQTGLFAPLHNEESMVVQKIKNHLIHRPDNPLPLFTNFYEDLQSVTDTKFRTSILTLLLALSEQETKLPSVVRYNFKDMNSVLDRAQSGTNIRPVSNTSDLRNYRQLNSKGPSLATTLLDNNSRPRSISYPRRTMYSDNTPQISSSASESETPVNLSASENLIQEIIYVLTGKVGKYLKKGISGEFKLDIKARNLNVQEAGILLRASEIGFIHNEIQKFTDSNSEYYLCGLFGQGLISHVEAEITELYAFVAMLQETLNRQRNKSYLEWEKGDNLTLIKVMSYVAEPSNHLKSIHQILNSCKDLKGGPLLSALYNQMFNCDPNQKTIVKSMLIAACRPLQTMLSHWLLDGEIKDPHNEFFIEEIKEVSSDQLWHYKYRIMKARLPTFISHCLAKKILTSGKSINFLREVCEDKSPIKGREELKQCFENNIEDLFAIVPDTKLMKMIDNVYLNTSKKVLDIALGTYRLLEHLQAMRKYLLLGQGDFIGLLMENLKEELDRPAKDLYQHALFSILAASVRATSQYDDADILEHLDVKLFYPVQGDKGWDVFTLKYTVKGPLATILELNMIRYQELFKPLWKAKHVEFVLSNIWKEQMINSKALRQMNKVLNPVTYRLHLYTSEMIHFIHQMQYYVLFEVIECSWTVFIKRVQNAQALDDILEAHEQFLDTIRSGAFLDNENQQTLYVNLETVYNSIMKLEEWQKQFYELCFKELNSRVAYENHIKESEKNGEYGVTAEKRLERDEEIKIFEQALVGFQRTLVSIGNDYENYVRYFLCSLTSSTDHNLQLFGIRLDFNEHYRKREQKIHQTLTFEHMRSSGMGTSLFGSMSNRMSNSRIQYNN